MGALSKRNDDPSMPRGRSTGTATGSCSARAPASWSSRCAEHALERGATIHAEVIGAALTADAFHISAPEPTGRGACMAMTKAMRDAGVAPDEIDYIVAHGTSHAAQRRHRDARDQGARSATHAHKVAISLAQVDGRPHARRGGGDQRVRRDRRHPRGHHPADDQPREARPARVRPRLRAPGRAPGDASTRR